MTLYLHLPESVGKVQQLTSQAGTEILPAPLLATDHQSARMQRN
jgi:hypothetical protein